LADAYKDEMGVSEGISFAERAETKECDDKRVAAKARTDNFTFTIIVRCICVCDGSKCGEFKAWNKE